MHQQPNWSSFILKWPMWRLCVCSVFFGFVTWAVIVDHPVKWFLLVAVPLAVVLANDVRNVLRGRSG